MIDNGNEHQNGRYLLSEAGFDRVEIMILNISRQYLLSYSDNRYPYWENAIDMALGSYGSEQGPKLAVMIMRVLQVMRATRKNVFKFINPTCLDCANQLTDCERHFINTIRYTRRCNPTKALAEAMILCEGFDTTTYMTSIRHLVSQLESAELGAEDVI